MIQEETNDPSGQPEFWESSFTAKQEMWGLEPAASAVWTLELFVRESVKHVLVPGIGYGRNAHLFTESGMSVTGIEISPTAIALARKHYGDAMTIYKGSVTDMPFDNRRYDGIFCYALIHLLDRNEREKLIAECYAQLTENGTMVFTAISKTAPTYGQGKPIGKNRFEQFGGVSLFFYDRESIAEEFGQAGLQEIVEIQENYPFYVIRCRKE